MLAAVTTPNNNQLWDRFEGGPDYAIFSFCDERTLAKLQTVCRTWQQTLVGAIDERGREIDTEYGPALVMFCRDYNISLRQLPVLPTESMITINRAFGFDGTLHGVQSVLMEHMTSPMMRYNDAKGNAAAAKAREGADESDSDDERCFKDNGCILMHVVPTLLGRLCLQLRLEEDARLENHLGAGLLAIGIPESASQEVVIMSRTVGCRIAPPGLLAGTHRLMRIRDDQRTISVEANALAAVITAVAFAFNWFLQG